MPATWAGDLDGPAVAAEKGGVAPREIDGLEALRGGDGVTRGLVPVVEELKRLRPGASEGRSAMLWR